MPLRRSGFRHYIDYKTVVVGKLPGLASSVVEKLYIDSHEIVYIELCEIACIELCEIAYIELCEIACIELCEIACIELCEIVYIELCEMGRPTGIEPMTAVPQTAVITTSPWPPYIKLKT